ncbi:MAG TPA: BON domain-containing protein [Ramlibacter sp.]|nr:BON domain-containing protein [Ramlibacter sp.]
MKLNRQTLLLPLLLATALGSLSACAPLVIGGAAVGTMAYFDRRTSGTQVEDETIELRAGSRLGDAIPAGHINITSYNRQVLITGEVPTEAAKQLAGTVAAKVENVKGILNELAVATNTGMSSRSSDALITGQVKASFLDEKKLYSGAFKVVTERGIVYLMGRVTKTEADLATQIARGVRGVQRVVRIFEILSDEELRQLAAQGTPAPAPAKPASAAQ